MNAPEPRRKTTMTDLDPEGIEKAALALVDAEHDHLTQGELTYAQMAQRVVAAYLEHAHPAKAAALTAVLGLHKPERRYMPYEGADVSYSTEREAIEASADVDLGAVAIVSLLENGAPYFDLCAHCKAIEDSPCDGDCTQEAGYRESLYPCPTARAITEHLSKEDHHG